VLIVAYIDTCKIRKLLLRQYGIHFTPFPAFHEDTTKGEMVIIRHILKNAERDFLHVHRNDSRQERSKPSVALACAPAIEVKETEMRIVM
jgi:hypothetical protein